MFSLSCQLHKHELRLLQADICTATLYCIAHTPLNVYMCLLKTWSLHIHITKYVNRHTSRWFHPNLGCHSFSQSHLQNMCIIPSAAFIERRHAVAQLVKPPRYKREGRGFDSRCCQLNFSGLIMVLVSNQPLTEKSTRNISCGEGGG
jgi:hypothetical protein